MRSSLSTLLTSRPSTLYPAPDPASTSPGGFITYGFECDDGWFGLLYALSVVLDRRSQEKGLSPRVFQVKEKFGTLRYYVHGVDEFGRGAVQFAEAYSERLSLRSGSPGLLHMVGGWAATLALGEELDAVCRAEPEQLASWIAGCGPFRARRRLEADYRAAAIDIRPGGADMVSVLLKRLDLGDKLHMLTWRRGGQLEISADGLTDEHLGTIELAGEMARIWVHPETGATGPVSDQGQPIWV